MMLTAFALSLIIGAKVEVKDATTGELFCGKLAAVDSYERAWIIPDTNPQWYFVRAAGDVQLGCTK